VEDAPSENAPRDAPAASPNALDDTTPPKGRRYERYWELSESGVHRVSRPIVIDGLTKPVIRIELAPRIKVVDGGLVDDSYHAVEKAAAQFYRSLTLEQLVMASVALQVHLRKNKEHLQKKRELQEQWTVLARRMKRLRVEDEHLSEDERRLGEKSSRLLGGERASMVELVALEAEELAQRRDVWRREKAEAQRLWTELEVEDARLVGGAPQLEKTEDLRHPYVLTLLQSRPNPSRPRRSVASAMHALVEALQKPLSRTDQILLDIALRRCVRALVPESETDGIRFEKGLMSRAEADFAREFAWAVPYVSAAPAA
jgi:hypothetical protein